ncbi:MAG: hypothetical protein R3B06_30685 [Kofleriaceae bacterium]
MHTKTAIFAATLGAAFATAFILSCSDDSPGNADAAVCDCPAAEAPLAGRIMRVVSQDITIVATEQGGNSVSCPAGATVLGGGCEQVGGPFAGVHVIVAAPVVAGSSQGFQCEWQSDLATDTFGRAVAICLLPPQ